MAPLGPPSTRQLRASRSRRRHRWLMGWVMGVALLLTVALVVAGLVLVDDISVTGPLQITTDTTGAASAYSGSGYVTIP